MQKSLMTLVVYLNHHLMIFSTKHLTPMVATQDATGLVNAKLTSARSESLLFLLIGIISVIVAVRAKKHKEINRRKRDGFIAAALAIIAVLFSTIRIAAAEEFGSGGGKAGAILAMIVGIIGIAMAMRTILRAQSKENHN